MKYGFCASMAALGPAGVGADLIRPAREAGFDYIELPVAQIMALDAREFSGILGRLEEAGLPCLVCNNLFPAALSLTGPAHSLEDVTAYFRAALERVKALGARTVVFGSPGARQVPEGFRRDLAWGQLERVMGRICPLAERSGVAVAVEPICAAESNIINTVEEAARLAAHSGCGNAGAMGEFYQMRRQGDPFSALEAYGPLIRHVHIARSADHTYPADRGEDEYEGFVRALRAGGYDGTVSIEGKPEGGDFVTVSSRALALLRTLEQEAGR